MNRSKSVAIVAAAIVAWGTAAAAESARLPASTDFTLHWYPSLEAAPQDLATVDPHDHWYPRGAMASPLAAGADFTVHWYPEADDGALTIARAEPLASAKR